MSTVDPRLWAFLRILYAKKEHDLLKHGCTPFSLMSAGSVLSADIEAQVIKTLVGVTGVLLRVYGSDMKVTIAIILVLLARLLACLLDCLPATDPHACTYFAIPTSVDRCMSFNADYPLIDAGRLASPDDREGRQRGREQECWRAVSHGVKHRGYCC